MRVFDKTKTGNELMVHNWFYTEEGWIRLTDLELKKARASATKNPEDTPELSWFKRLLYSLIFY